MSRINHKRQILNEQRQHQKELKNLTDHHKNEIEKTRLLHKKHKDDIKSSTKEGIANLRLLGADKKISQLRKNEKVLEDLSSNLKRVQDTTQQEKMLLKQAHQKIISDKKRLHDLDYKNLNQKNHLDIQELNESSQEEISNLRRHYNRERESIKNQNELDLKQIEDFKNLKLDSKKRLFALKDKEQNEKFARALRKTQMQQNNVMREQVSKFQDTMSKREEYHNESLENLDKTRHAIRNQKKEHFEKVYNKQLEKHQKDFQTMIGKKDQLIHKLESELKEKQKLFIERKDDQFYHMGKLDYQISELSNEKAYLVKVPVREEEANHISLKAEKRQLRLHYKRSHKFKNDQDGRADSINKMETYSSKTNVDQIMDSSKLERFYKDGALYYKIPFA